MKDAPNSQLSGHENSPLPLLHFDPMGIHIHFETEAIALYHAEVITHLIERGWKRAEPLTNRMPFERIWFECDGPAEAQDELEELRRIHNGAIEPSMAMGMVVGSEAHAEALAETIGFQPYVAKREDGCWKIWDGMVLGWATA